MAQHARLIERPPENGSDRSESIGVWNSPNDMSRVSLLLDLVTEDINPCYPQRALHQGVE